MRAERAQMDYTLTNLEVGIILILAVFVFWALPAIDWIIRKVKNVRKNKR